MIVTGVRTYTCNTLQVKYHSYSSALWIHFAWQIVWYCERGEICVIQQHNASMTAYCLLQVKVRDYWCKANKPDWGNIQYLCQFVNPITRAYSQKAWQALRKAISLVNSLLCESSHSHFPLLTDMCMLCCIYVLIDWLIDLMNRSVAAQREQKPQPCC